jgi:proteasome accessory factor C
LAPLAEVVLSNQGRLTPLEPPELVELVERSLERVADVHDGDPSRPRVIPPTGVEPAPAPTRTPGPVAPERFAILQALLAFLLERCGDEPSATVPAADIRDRFHLTQKELEEHLDLLNLVNFGGGCYAVYCATENGSILVDKELYGDTFRRPARLSPLEAKAVLRALDVIAPLVAAQTHRPLSAVRDKIEAAFGEYSLSDTPAPAPTMSEEGAVTTLNEAVRDRRLVRISYLSRYSDTLSEREIEPHLLRRDERGWAVEAWDRTAEGRRTFRVEFVREAELLDERFERRPEMEDVHPGEESWGTARVLFAKARAGRQLEEQRRVQPTRGGGALAVVAYGSQGWLVSEILRHRGEAELLEPAPVREQVRTAALDLLAELSGARAR